MDDYNKRLWAAAQALELGSIAISRTFKDSVIGSHVKGFHWSYWHSSNIFGFWGLTVLITF